MRFNLIAIAACAIVMSFSSPARAQTVLAIGNISKVEDTTPILWGIGGLEIFTVKPTVAGWTPIMRTQLFDARTVEILCRTQAPRLRTSDVKSVSMGSHNYIMVRQYLLIEVTPQDANGENMSKAALAEKWASRLGSVLPKIAPEPSKFAI